MLFCRHNRQNPRNHHHHRCDEEMRVLHDESSCSVGTTSLPISGIRFEEEKSFLLQRFAKDIGAFLEVL